MRTSDQCSTRSCVESSFLLSTISEQRVQSWGGMAVVVIEGVARRWLVLLLSFALVYCALLAAPFMPSTTVFNTPPIFDHSQKGPGRLLAICAHRESERFSRIEIRLSRKSGEPHSVASKSRPAPSPKLRSRLQPEKRLHHQIAFIRLYRPRSAAFHQRALSGLASIGGGLKNGQRLWNAASERWRTIASTACSVSYLRFCRIAIRIGG